MNFPKLYKEVKQLIWDGVYSLYSVKGQDWYYLRIPAKPPCCNIHPGPGADYKIANDGEVLGNVDPKTFEIEAVIDPKGREEYANTYRSSFPWHR